MHALLFKSTYETFFYTTLLTGIKAIKLYAWEEAYMERVKELRETELRHIRHTQLLSLVNMGACFGCVASVSCEPFHLRHIQLVCEFFHTLVSKQVVTYT